MDELEQALQVVGMTDAGQPLTNFDAGELSPQDRAEHVAQLLARAYERTNLIEIVEVRASAAQIHLLGRVKKENEKDMVNILIEKVLRATKGVCDTFMGKNYFLKNDDFVYGWAISFSSADLMKTAHVVCDTIDESFPRPEVTHSPLMGPPPPQSRVKPVR